VSDNPVTGNPPQAEVIRNPAPGGTLNSARAVPPGAGSQLACLPVPVPGSHEDSDTAFAHMAEQLDRHGRCKSRLNTDSVWALVMFAHQSERTLMARDLVTAYDLLEWLRREHGITATPEDLAEVIYDAGTEGVGRLYPDFGGMIPYTWAEVRSLDRASTAMWLSAAQGALTWLTRGRKGKSGE
jgi:hypothetical protein